MTAPEPDLAAIKARLDAADEAASTSYESCRAADDAADVVLESLADLATLVAYAEQLKADLAAEKAALAEAKEEALQDSYLKEGLVAMVSALEAELAAEKAAREKSEADAAAMREALERIKDWAQVNGQWERRDYAASTSIAALSSDAGASLLERLRKAEGERDATLSVIRNWPDPDGLLAARDELAAELAAEIRTREIFEARCAEATEQLAEINRLRAIETAARGVLRFHPHSRGNGISALRAALEAK